MGTMVTLRLVSFSLFASRGGGVGVGRDCWGWEQRCRVGTGVVRPWGSC